MLLQDRECVSVTHFEHNKIVTQMVAREHLAMGQECSPHTHSVTLIPDMITIALSR